MMPRLRRAFPWVLLLVSLAMTGIQVRYTQQARRERALRALCTAVERNDADAAQILLRGGLDPNAPFRFPARPVRFLDTLRGAFAPVPAPPRTAETTLLDMAATGGRTAVLELLLRNGADPNATDRWDRTPLMKMMDNGAVADPASVRILIDGGADVNRKNRYGVTALMWTIHRTGNPAEICIRNVRTLLSCGADINAGDGWNHTALSAALDRANMFRSEEENRLVFFLKAHGANDADVKNVGL